MNYTVVRLSQQLVFDVKDFLCEYKMLNDYLTDPSQALADTEKEKELTYLIISPKLNKPVAYFSLRCSIIRTINKDDSTNTYPIIELTKLAVDLRYRGQGNGNYSMVYILKFINELCSIMPIAAITVMAAPNAVGFYEKFNFKRLPPKNMYVYTRVVLLDCITMFYPLAEDLIEVAI